MPDTVPIVYVLWNVTTNGGLNAGWNGTKHLLRQFLWPWMF
jgi:hypothetical protein